VCAAAVDKICVIGVGLIGGSFARALKRGALCGHIVGCGRSEQSLRRALELGVIDSYSTRPAEAVAGAGLVMVATPLGAMREVFSAICPALDAGAVVTDAGSAKAAVIEAVVQACGRLPANFVPGHPIAGTENSGVEASFAELFDRHRVILTPLPQTSPDALALVRGLWQQIGAEVTTMDVDEHDQVLAATSHLPHVLAFALVASLAHRSERQKIFDYAAGGFRDFTRIASSDPRMWRDICVDNSRALLDALREFRADLDQLAAAIEARDGDRIIEVFSAAKQARDQFVADKRKRPGS